MIKVSAVIPVYNRTDTLKDAVESVLFQDYSNIEIIVVDDGSETDLSVILKPYLHFINFIKLDRNYGVSRARNEGIKAANGEFIAFLDSDDVWLPFKISHQLELMQKEGTKVCHTHEFWFKTDRFINQSKKHTRYGGEIFPHILDICRISDSSLMVARDVFDVSGMFNEDMKVCEDYELFLRITSQFKVSYSEKKCIIKRSITDDQLSASIKHIESIRMVALENFIQNSKNLRPDLKEAALSELERKKTIVLSGLKSSGSGLE